MEEFRLAQEIKFPITPHSPYYNEIWRFEPLSCSFFISMGVGLLKSVFESSDKNLQLQLLTQIREIPNRSFNSIPHFEGAKDIFKHLLKLKKKTARAPHLLGKIQNHLTDPNRSDIIYSINLLTKALFVARDDTQLEDIMEEKVNIPEESLIRSLCGSLEINLHIVSEAKIERIDTKQSGPLISLHLENEHYGLMLKTYENSDLSSFPYVLEHTQQEANKKKVEEIIRILVDGFDPSGISDESLSTITVFLENNINDEDLVQSIRQKLNNSVKESATFVPVCGKEHLLKELYTNCKNNNYYCPCLKKLSPKNIDYILDRKRNRGGSRSIKSIANRVESIGSNAKTSLAKSEPDRREYSSPEQSLKAHVDLIEPKEEHQEEPKEEHQEEEKKEKATKAKGKKEEAKQEEGKEQKKITSENPANYRKLNCRHRGEDPMSCHGHEFCLRCRYESLTSKFKCFSCDRIYHEKEKEKLWDWLAKKKDYPIETCPNCKKVSLLVVPKICLTCGIVSNINTLKK